MIRALKIAGATTAIAIVLYPVLFSLWMRRVPSSGQSCIANLKQLDGAKATWELEQGKTNLNESPMDADLFGTTLYIREKPKCPKGGVYSLGKLSEKPRCSIPNHSIELGDVYVFDEGNSPLEGADVSASGKTGYATFNLTWTNGCANVSWVSIKHATGLTIRKRGYSGVQVPLTNQWPLKIVLRRLPEGEQ